MLIDQIKSANIQALKDKDTVSRTIFGVLLNKIKLQEIENRKNQQELDDTSIVLIIQKTIKELEEEKENYKKANNFTEFENIQHQIKTVERFLPDMMSEKEIFDIISNMEDKSIPNVMKTFKSKYNGKCDMRLVNEILRRF